MAETHSNGQTQAGKRKAGVRAAGGTTGNLQGSRQRPRVDASQQRRRQPTADVNANFRGAVGAQKPQAKTRKPSGSHAKQPAQKPRKALLAKGAIAGGIILLAVTVACVALGILTPHDSGTVSAQSQAVAAKTETASESSKKAATSVSFCAVGANIANDDILKSADAWGGASGDGVYEFSPLYEQMKGIVSGYDIAFLNQATTLGGHTSFEYQGYPSYNTPDTMADAVAAAGFNVVNCNTNHTYDMWVDAIAHSQSVWAQHPEITTIGSYSSEDDRANIRMVEKNGMTIAFLSYCYGQNGYTADQLPNDYFATPFNKDKMRAEVAKAKEAADAVVVYMHWNETDEVSGSQDTSTLSDEQQNYASYLAGLGVDLVLGCRGQSIQPVSYVGRGIRTTDGSGVTAANGMLCVYGLGDFASAYTLPSAVLSGMFTCDFVRDANGEVSIDNPTWHALIEHRNAGVDCVYPLTSYTADLAASNELLNRLNEGGATTDRLQWARDTTVRTVGNAIAVEV
ncbi:MAG: CapA family protein [Atopobiaceae bacterium]|nr:CapA family protein [Atopobiaceae bacterium]